MENSTKLGYVQPGNRYFWKINDEVHFEAGFKSKEDFDNHYNEHWKRRDVEWRAANLVKFYGEPKHWTLVDKNGKHIKF